MNPLSQVLEESFQRRVEIPVEVVSVIDPVGRREAGAEGILESIPLRAVLLEMDRQGPWLGELRDAPHFLLDDGVDFVVGFRRLVVEAADLDEQLFPLAQAREELHEVLRRDDPDRLVVLRHDDR